MMPPAVLPTDTTHPLPVRIRVEAPARLHLGFIDVSGSAGRRFGSMGLAIEGYPTVLEAQRCDPGRDGSPRLDIHAPMPELADRLRAAVAVLAEHLQRPLSLRLRCVQHAPAHSGFGTGTQLALALASSVVHLYGLDTSPRTLAALLDRGQRSGIGLGAFERGGFIVDGGRATDDAGRRTPPTVAGLPFPEDWRIILLFDSATHGLSGSAETRAFADLPPFPVEAAHRLAHGVLMGALPALAEQDITAFGASVGTLQAVVGDHFAPVQGSRFTSPAVTAALQWLQGQGVQGVGQSSWGPTGFAIVGSATEAERHVAGVQAALPDSGLSYAVVKGRNRGADIVLDAPPFSEESIP